MVRPVLRCCSWCCSYQIVMEELRGDTPDTFDCEIRLVSFFFVFFFNSKYNRKGKWEKETK